MLGFSSIVKLGSSNKTLIYKNKDWWLSLDYIRWLKQNFFEKVVFKMPFFLQYRHMIYKKKCYLKSYIIQKLYSMVVIYRLNY